MFDVDRNQVDEQDVEVDRQTKTLASVGVPTLEPGLYTVEFSNVSSVDGHPWSGIIQFIILNPDGTVPPGAEFDPDALTGEGAGSAAEEHRLGTEMDRAAVAVHHRGAAVVRAGGRTAGGSVPRR